MITISRLTKRYGDRLAVDDLTFDVAAGRVTGFVGPNGAGQSTTLRMMVGLTRPDSGEVRFTASATGTSRAPRGPSDRSSTPAACIPNARPGTPAGHRRPQRCPRRRVEEVLAEVGLETAADQRAGKFSYGMRQRLALAAALLGDPQILLLDEPSNGLDPDGIRWLRDHISDFAGRGGTFFVSSHLISELSMFADDLLVVGGGRLLAAQSVRAITGSTDITVIVETPQRAELVSFGPVISRLSSEEDAARLAEQVRRDPGRASNWQPVPDVPPGIGESTGVEANV